VIQKQERSVINAYQTTMGPRVKSAPFVLEEFAAT